MYKLERLVDGEWLMYGDYTTLDRVCKSCFAIGKGFNNTTDIRVTEVGNGLAEKVQKGTVRKSHNSNSKNE